MGPDPKGFSQIYFENCSFCENNPQDLGGRVPSSGSGWVGPGSQEFPPTIFCDFFLRKNVQDLVGWVQIRICFSQNLFCAKNV